MAFVYANRVKVTTATTGTGTITLGSAVSGFQTFADGGVANGDTCTYLIEDGSAWEIGTGTYSSTGPTLARSVIESTNADAAINLSGSATVSIVSDAVAYNKLVGIEANADVTDTANVTAAGALMDSELADITAIKTLQAPDNTTISTFGATLVDDADAATARATLDVDQAGTDNSTDVTLAGTPDYITISGQVITRNPIDLTADVTGVLPEGNLPDASSTAQGVVELAIASEINTGTDTARAVTPDALAGSNLGTFVVEITAFNASEDVAVGNGAAFFQVPAAMNGMNLVDARAAVYTAGTTNATTVQVHNITDAADMLSANISIASSGVTGTGTVNGATDDVATNDRLRIDVDAVSTTAPKGLVVTLEFRLP